MAREKIKVKAVLFDLDGTLIDSIDAYLGIVNTVFGRLGLALPEREEVLKVMQYIKNPWESLVPHDRDDREQIIEECRKIDKEVVQQVFGRQLKLIDGSLGVLKNLKSRGFPVGIVTDREVPVKKPAPDGILECLRQLGCQPAEAVYVGDSPVDVMAGKAAGTFTVGVLTGTSKREILADLGPDMVVNDVGELAEVIELLD
jgi:phosphoglycolate phosphatase-like HAD superfamily hydrolase